DINMRVGLAEATVGGKEYVIRASSQYTFYAEGNAIHYTGQQPNFGDHLRVEKLGQAIKYYINNVLKHTYSVTSPLGKMTGIVTLASIGGGIKSSSISGGYNKVHLISALYNEVGQLVSKRLHNVGVSSAKQSVDYRYNIRGWLT